MKRGYFFPQVVPRHSEQRCVSRASVEQFGIEVVACLCFVRLRLAAVRFEAQNTEHLCVSVRTSQVVQIHAVDAAGRVVARRAIARNRFLSWFANLKPCMVVMEASSAAYYWARKLHALGHEVRHTPPQFVAPTARAAPA